MAKMTTAEKLHGDLMKILEEYSDEVSQKSEDCVKEVGKKGAKALRSSSPKGATGDYASGWTSKVETDRINGAVAIIHNKRKPGLPHLLEHGHVTRNGTDRKFDDTPAHPHIASVEEQIAKEFMNSIKVKLS